jgi:hypothetical protein
MRRDVTSARNVVGVAPSRRAALVVGVALVGVACACAAPSVGAPSLRSPAGFGAGARSGRLPRRVVPSARAAGDLAGVICSVLTNPTVDKVSELVSDLLDDDRNWTIAGTLAAQAVNVGSTFCKAGLEMAHIVIPNLLRSPLISSPSMQRRVLRLVGPFITGFSVRRLPSVVGGWMVNVQPIWYDPYSDDQGKYTLWYRWSRDDEPWSQWSPSPRAEQLYLAPNLRVEFAVRVTDSLGITSPYGYSGVYPSFGSLGYS